MEIKTRHFSILQKRKNSTAIFAIYFCKTKSTPCALRSLMLEAHTRNVAVPVLGEPAPIWAACSQEAAVSEPL